MSGSVKNYLKDQLTSGQDYAKGIGDQISTGVGKLQDKPLSAGAAKALPVSSELPAAPAQGSSPPGNFFSNASNSLAEKILGDPSRFQQVSDVLSGKGSGSLPRINLAHNVLPEWLHQTPIATLVNWFLRNTRGIPEMNNWYYGKGKDQLRDHLFQENGKYFKSLQSLQTFRALPREVQEVLLSSLDPKYGKPLRHILQKTEGYNPASTSYEDMYNAWDAWDETDGWRENVGLPVINSVLANTGL